MAARYDWETIRAEYEAGSTMGELSRKHGVDKAAISRKAKKEAWLADLSEVVNKRAEAKVNGLVNTVDPKKKAEAVDRGVAPIKSDKNLRIFLRPPKEISSDRALLPMPHCCKNARLNPSGALRAAFAFFRLCGILGLRGSGGNFFEKRFLFSSILPR
jgi:hypothetical protein